ncbi:thioredoxin-like protein [Phlyctochytrium arcticum]|nr:thioredoxin-like protein [Phlyctochytrium arcticum]
MATKHNVVELSSESQFPILVGSRPLTVLNFWAAWADPCTDMNAVFAELSNKFPGLTFVQIEAENFGDIAEEYEIAAVPTFLVLGDGGKKVLARIEGANAGSLSSTVEKYAGAGAAAAKTTPTANPAAPTPTTITTIQPQPAPTTEKKDLTFRLKTLVSSHPVMVFIKGTPQAPRCGFSRETVSILSDLHVPYGSFNILADEEVRQGLKTFSAWPTFPQIYIHGELIGGLDILKEMVASGEFQKLAPIEEDLDTRLTKLINRAPVMLFMKGDPTTPKCGFSRQITKLLSDNNITYDTFDILEDEEVRQGLKTFSSWPTYPQVYIKGELVGGLDIVKEMAAAGELTGLVS